MAAALLPEAPPGFRNETDPHRSGVYLFGYEDFRVLDVPVAGPLHRTVLGQSEDFALGVISVFLIALISEIVQTVLMRTRESRVSRRGLHLAYVLDEVHHFRNVWRLVRRDPTCRRSPFRRSVAYNSLIIVFLAAALLAAEVLAVYLTQPLRLYTTAKQYNIKGEQPTGTTDQMAVHIDHLTKRKRCVTPSMIHSNQSREYTLNACIMRRYNRALARNDSKAEFVRVSSWYHEGGSDHRLEYGNGTHTGWQEMETRATMMQGTEGWNRGLLFNIRDNEEMDHARYLQQYMIRMAIQWSCRQPFETRPCEQLGKQVSLVNITQVSKNVTIWQHRDDREYGEARGIKTHFEFGGGLQNPHAALENAIHVLATSAVIVEVQGPGMYINFKTRERESYVPRLVSEEGRIAGLMLLLIIFGALFVVLILMRVCLRPVSLAHLARSVMEDGESVTVRDFLELEEGRERFDRVEKSADSSVSSLDHSLEHNISPRRLKTMLSKGRKAKGQVTDLESSDWEGDDCHSSVTIDSS